MTYGTKLYCTSTPEVLNEAQILYRSKNISGMGRKGPQFPLHIYPGDRT